MRGAGTLDVLIECRACVFRAVGHAVQRLIQKLDVADQRHEGARFVAEEFGQQRNLLILRRFRNRRQHLAHGAFCVFLHILGDGRQMKPERLGGVPLRLLGKLAFRQCANDVQHGGARRAGIRTGGDHGATHGRKLFFCKAAHFTEGADPQHKFGHVLGLGRHVVRQVVDGVGHITGFGDRQTKLRFQLGKAFACLTCAEIEGDANACGHFREALQVFGRYTAFTCGGEQCGNVICGQRDFAGHAPDAAAHVFELFVIGFDHLFHVCKCRLETDGRACGRFQTARDAEIASAECDRLSNQTTHRRNGRSGLRPQAIQRPPDMPRGGRRIIDKRYAEAALLDTHGHSLMIFRNSLAVSK
ncbi:hypothetical protein D3C87_1324150 [compost metagenome]